MSRLGRHGDIPAAAAKIFAHPPLFFDSKLKMVESLLLESVDDDNSHSNISGECGHAAQKDAVLQYYPDAGLSYLPASIAHA